MMGSGNVSCIHAHVATNYVGKVFRLFSGAGKLISYAMLLHNCIPQVAFVAYVLDLVG